MFRLNRISRSELRNIIPISTSASTVRGARLQHQTHVIGAFVAHIAKDRDLLGLDQFRDLLDQLGFLHLIGDLGDHDLPLATAQILDLPFAAQPERPAPGAIGLGDALARLDDHAAGREIGARHILQQRLVPRIGRS